jgi:hypothetical protein
MQSLPLPVLDASPIPGPFQTDGRRHGPRSLAEALAREAARRGHEEDAMGKTAREALLGLAVQIGFDGGARNLALSSTLEELAEDLAGYRAGDVAQAYHFLDLAYTREPPSDPAWKARAATVTEIADGLAPDHDPESTCACQLWDDLIRGVERRRDAGPARTEAMLFTMRYERRLLGEAAGEGDAGPYPSRGGFTPRGGPSEPGAASFDAAG